eukprot:CAMPEP_0204278254 /NCGR_PEP_ID=MMETSP0468-20130131/29762_1 /ASSEMBLY_ACC=CAM_ASM_000383 /TAXON_ID=2969 /ORGANISM="Oxyrrhis marina" /LENGTH=157 /DNA_ID=CAMNT_0051255135 /DNA_START=26 /DNA_END=496 /DNA_ORIENTATION=-
MGTPFLPSAADQAHSTLVDLVVECHLAPEGWTDPGARRHLSALLARLEREAERQGLPAADRGYRKQFSLNYSAVFPDHSRIYLVDILVPALRGDDSICMNRETHRFPPTLCQWGGRLRDAWEAVAAALEGGTGFASLLAELDLVWVRWEELYVGELM